MFKPRILTILLVFIFLCCKESQTPSAPPQRLENSDPATTTPELRKRDTLRMSPAKRELRKKEDEARKKGLDTLKPVTT